MFQHAIVRLPGASYADGLTRVDLGAPSLALALHQHAAYCDALRTCGVDVTVLPPDPAFPDSTFVEDTAIVLPEGALLMRPGAPSRRGEVHAIRAALAAHFGTLAAIAAPGNVDGGDVCVLEASRRAFIGISARTDDEGAAQLARWFESHGYHATLVDIRAMTSILHLKSGIAALAGDRLLLIEELASHPAFAALPRLVVHADEAYGANAVQVNARVLVAAGHPRLLEQLVAAGYDPLPLAMSEFAKLDGGLSCLSLRF